MKYAGRSAKWDECAEDWLEREDKKPNATWRGVFAHMRGQTTTDLLAAQRHWIAYKDSSLRLLREWRPGT